MTVKVFANYITKIRKRIKNCAAKVAGFQNGVDLKKNLAFFFIGFVFVFMFTQSFRTKTFKNTSDSVPQGIYVEEKNAKISANDIVALATENIDFPFGSRPPYLLKVAGGLPGDYLRITADDITVNDQLLVSKPFPKTDFSLMPFYFDGVIPGGFVFVYTIHSNSYDSRYFGLVSLDKLIKTEKKEKNE